MKTKTGLWALGVFTIAGAVTISCGGSSDSGDDTGNPTAGTTSTTGGTTSTTGGTATTTGGTTTTTGGTATTTGGTTTTTGGTGNNGGRNNNAGGDSTAAGGDSGNANGLPDCAAGVADMGMCTPKPGRGAQNSCQLDDNTVCTCQTGRGQNPMSTYRCRTFMLPGAGGAGGGLGGTVTCPANAMSAQACTGIGQCPGQNGCACFNSKVFCR